MLITDNTVGFLYTLCRESLQSSLVYSYLAEFEQKLD